MGKLSLAGFLTAVGALLSFSPDAFAAEDLITADKTLFVQFLIFLAALYILNSLFFKPLLELADKRDGATSGSGKEADELVRKAEMMDMEYDAAVKQARELALEQRAQLTKSALEESEKIVSSSREEARLLLEKQIAGLASQVNSVKAEMRSEIEDIANRVTRAVRGVDSGDV